MATQYGIGQYEEDGSPDRPSLWHMRWELLSTVVELRPALFFELFRIIDFDQFQFEDGGSETKDAVFYVAFLYLFQGNPLGVNVPEDVIDTPLHRFFSLVSGVKETLEEKMGNLKRIHPRWEPDEIFIAALTEVHGNWGSMREETEAFGFRTAIEAWGKENNLDHEWIYDFILLIFQNLYVFLDTRVKSIQKEEIDSRDAKGMRESFDYRIGKAIRTSLLTFYLQNVSNRILEVDTQKIKSDPFFFRHEAIEWGPKVWLPLSQTRTDFVAETIRDFAHWRAAVEVIGEHKQINQDAYRDRLTDYCNAVEKLNKTETVPEFRDIFEHYWQQFTFIASTWVRAEQDRDSFIIECVEKISTKFNDFKECANSLKTLPADKLDNDLYSYCNKVDLAVPSDFVGARRMNDPEKHFRWLVEFQVPPVRSFSRLAKDYPGDDHASTKGIEMAVRRLSGQLGLRLRKSEGNMGRPKGRKTKIIGSAGRTRK